MRALLLSSVCFAAAALAGCSSTYYTAMEKIGFPKREILVDRVDKTREAQAEAKQQFTSALEHFLAVTKIDGGDLQRKYDDLNREYERSEARAKEVRERIAAVDDVADALFNEWLQELGQYSSAALRSESQRELDQTRRRYSDLMQLMKRAADRMDPVLASFHDQVLFLKHNLNARAFAKLENNHRELENDIARLIADMEKSIREADSFVRDLREKP